MSQQLSEYLGGDCPFGGKCVDTGVPTDCEVNSRCFNFKSVEERNEFDAKLDGFYFRFNADKNSEVRFKTENQLEFFLRDLDISVKSKAEWGTINRMPGNDSFR